VFPNPDAIESPVRSNAMQVMCSRRCPSILCLIISTNVDALGSELCPCLLDLCHQLRVCLRYVVEGEDAPAELEEKVCAEGNERPKRDLAMVSLDRSGDTV
jgi:hypothetical protein